MIRYRIDTDRSVGAKARKVAILTVDEETLEVLAQAVGGDVEPSGQTLIDLDKLHVELSAALLAMART